MGKAIADIASWLLRAVGATSAKLFIATFAVCTLRRLPDIESALVAQSSVSLRPPSPPGDHERGFAPQLEQRPGSVSTVSKHRGQHVSSV